MIIASLAVFLIAGCKREGNTNLGPPDPWSVGNPDRGSTLVNTYGCGSCHTISGIPNANGVVGPSLDGFAHRVYVAGMLRNSPNNLVTWIQRPQSVVPGNVMPDMGIGRSDARDIAAFLYTRK